MADVEDIEYVEVDEKEEASKEYDKLPEATKESIARIQGTKKVYESSEIKTYLLGAALGGGYAVYKRKKVLLGVAFGLLCAYFYIEFLDKPTKEPEPNVDGKSATQAE